MTPNQVSIREGWYIPNNDRSFPRWVLAVGNSHVYYSKGGGVSHCECRLNTMQRWVKTAKARFATDKPATP